MLLLPLRFVFFVPFVVRAAVAFPVQMSMRGGFHG